MTSVMPPGRNSVPETRFRLTARVSSANLLGIRPVIERTLPGVLTRAEGNEIIVEGEVRGGTAKELNRSLLSALRRVEKRTRIRSEWTAEGGGVERYFDYVLKAKSRP